MRGAILTLAVLFIAVPALAEDDPPTKEPSRVAAAGWCAVHSGDAEDEGVGCDIGVGASVYDFRRFHLVGVLGVETVGVGVARVVSAEGKYPVIAVAIGVVAPYSDLGIDASEATIALGATLTLARRE